MAETKDLTERELNIMAMAWLCFAEQPKPDYDKLAALTGFTNPKSVVNAWSLIKKKLAYKANNAGSDGGKSAITTPKSTPRKRGRKAEAEVEESPLKKAKFRKGKSSSATDASSQQDKDGEDEGDDDEETATIKGEQDGEDNEEEDEDEV